jgi:probable F420-dependent oxidoreductase
MQLGIALRNMGPQSAPDVFAGCAEAAEEAGLESLWVTDHIAIPPDDAEGSEGRYLDPLASLAFLAGRTRRIGLGTGVLVIPYRPALPTAKWIATIQELSGGRLLLGVGAGWMGAEFRALGIDRSRRGAITDATLDFLRRCFESDEVEAHGQRFLFRPRPARPPIYVGGAPPHALQRTVRFGDGWMPLGGDPEKLAEPIRALRAEKPDAEVVTFAALALDDPTRARDEIAALAAVGVTRVVHGAGRTDEAAFRRAVEGLARIGDGP